MFRVGTDLPGSPDSKTSQFGRHFTRVIVRVGDFVVPPESLVLRTLRESSYSPRVPVVDDGITDDQGLGYVGEGVTTIFPVCTGS